MRNDMIAGTKKALVCLSIVSAGLLSAGLAIAGDDPALAGENITSGMGAFQDLSGAEASLPTLVSGEYGTDTDNENNAHTGTADNDMDTYLFNDDTASPIEFNINVPVSNAPSRSATLRMDVYDVDAASGEVDDVYVNGQYVGTLNGSDGTWGVNIFDIPIGVLQQGKNLVEVDIDVNNVGEWAVTIDWGIIKLAAASGVQITKGWFSPPVVTRGNYINAFAEISDPAGKVATVNVYSGNTILFSLTDPDGDSTWSGQYMIPSSWTKGYKTLTFKALNANGSVLGRWPAINVK